MSKLTTAFAIGIVIVVSIIFVAYTRSQRVPDIIGMSYEQLRGQPPTICEYSIGNFDGYHKGVLYVLEGMVRFDTVQILEDRSYLAHIVVDTTSGRKHIWTDNGALKVRSLADLRETVFAGGANSRYSCTKWKTPDASVFEIPKLEYTDLTS